MNPITALQNVGQAMQDLLAILEAMSALQEMPEMSQRQRKAAEAEFHRPLPGKTMQVVKGRSKGMIGKVFWNRRGRVGLALNGELDKDGRFVNVLWVNAEWLRNMDPRGPDYSWRARISSSFER